VAGVSHAPLATWWCRGWGSARSRCAPQRSVVALDGHHHDLLWSGFPHMAGVPGGRLPGVRHRWGSICNMRRGWRSFADQILGTGLAKQPKTAWVIVRPPNLGSGVTVRSAGRDLARSIVSWAECTFIGECARRVKWSSPKSACSAKISPNSPGTEDHLVRKRSPVRVRPWGSKFNKDHCVASSRRFPLAVMGQGNALPQGFVSQPGMAGP
jgi:hypothetical protein